MDEPVGSLSVFLFLYFNHWQSGEAMTSVFIGKVIRFLDPEGKNAR